MRIASRNGTATCCDPIPRSHLLLPPSPVELWAPLVDRLNLRPHHVVHQADRHVEATDLAFAGRARNRVAPNRVLSPLLNVRHRRNLRFGVFGAALATPDQLPRPLPSSLRSFLAHLVQMFLPLSTLDLPDLLRDGAFHHIGCHVAQTHLPFAARRPVLQSVRRSQRRPSREKMIVASLCSVPGIIFIPSSRSSIENGFHFRALRRKNQSRDPVCALRLTVRFSS